MAFFNNTLKEKKMTTALQPQKITDIYQFFSIVQQKTGKFGKRHDLDNGSTIYTPYTLHAKQVAWLRLFDKSITLKRRALLGSRDKGKSEVISILGSAWAIYNDPKRKIAIMSFTFDNASKIVHNIVDILQSFGINLIYKNGGFYTPQNKQHTPSLMAMGLMSTVRMLHFDDLIMDDPLTVKEQFSKRYIQRSRSFINEGSSIAKRIILIGQLLTRHDIYYDAFSNVHQTYYLLQSWHGDIVELDKDLEYLLKTDGIKDVARNYLGYISDEDEAIFSQIIIDKSPLPADSKIYAYIDPSFEGHDYTAVALGWFVDGRIIIYGEIFKEDWGQCLEKIIDLVQGCVEIYYEKNGGVAPMGKMIRQSTQARVYGLSSSGNKIAKLYSMKAYVSLDKVRLHQSMPENAKKQIIEWTQTASHDDMPDAMSMLIIKLLGREKNYV